MVRFKHRYLLAELIWESSLDQLPPLSVVDPSPFPNSSPLPTSTLTSKRSLPSSAPLSAAPPPPPQFSESSLVHLLRDSLQANFGDLVSGAVGGTFSVKYLSPQTNTVILRVSREHFTTLWSSLTLLRKIGGVPVIVKVCHVSGTIRKIQHRAIQQDRKYILESHRRKLMQRQQQHARSEFIHSKQKNKPQAKGRTETGQGTMVGEKERGGNFTFETPVAEGQEEQAVEEKLKQSEEKIKAIEA